MVDGQCELDGPESDSVFYLYDDVILSETQYSPSNWIFNHPCPHLHEPLTNVMLPKNGGGKALM